MIKKKQILFYFFIASCGAIQAQDIIAPIDTSVWIFSSVQNASTNEVIEGAGKFILKGTQRIEWVQDNGEIQYDFSITRVEGVWTDYAHDGRVQFLLERRGRIGAMTFLRSDGRIEIQMEFVRDGKNVMPFVFEVDTVTKL